MIAHLWAETGADEVEAVLADDGVPCMVHAVNLCEVYYKVMRRVGEAEASAAIRDFRGRGLVVREDLDETFWRQVGSHKANVSSIPLADCFVVALANRLDAEAMTADHPDFDPVSEQGLCRVTFIR